MDSTTWLRRLSDSWLLLFDWLFVLDSVKGILPENHSTEMLQEEIAQVALAVRNKLESSSNQLCSLVKNFSNDRISLLLSSGIRKDWLVIQPPEKLAALLIRANVISHVAKKGILSPKIIQQTNTSREDLLLLDAERIEQIPEIYKYLDRIGVPSDLQAKLTWHQLKWLIENKADIDILIQYPIPFYTRKNPSDYPNHSVAQFLTVTNHLKPESNRNFSFYKDIAEKLQILTQRYTISECAKIHSILVDYDKSVIYGIRSWGVPIDRLMQIEPNILHQLLVNSDTIYNLLKREIPFDRIVALISKSPLNIPNIPILLDIGISFEQLEELSSEKLIVMLEHPKDVESLLTVTDFTTLISFEVEKLSSLLETARHFVGLIRFHKIENLHPHQITSLFKCDIGMFIKLGISFETLRDLDEQKRILLYQHNHNAYNLMKEPHLVSFDELIALDLEHLEAVLSNHCILEYMAEGISFTTLAKLPIAQLKKLFRNSSKPCALPLLQANIPLEKIVKLENEREEIILDNSRAVVMLMNWMNLTWEDLLETDLAQLKDLLKNVQSDPLQEPEIPDQPMHHHQLIEIAQETKIPPEELDSLPLDSLKAIINYPSRFITLLQAAKFSQLAALESNLFIQMLRYSNQVCKLPYKKIIQLPPTAFPQLFNYHHFPVLSFMEAGVPFETLRDLTHLFKYKNTIRAVEMLHAGMPPNKLTHLNDKILENSPLFVSFLNSGIPFDKILTCENPLDLIAEGEGDWIISPTSRIPFKMVAQMDEKQKQTMLFNLEKWEEFNSESQSKLRAKVPFEKIALVKSQVMYMLREKSEQICTLLDSNTPIESIIQM